MQTSSAIGFWGCGRGQFLDVWNCARTLEYVRQYMPNRYRYLKDCCPDICQTPPQENPAAPNADDYLCQPYTNPVDDQAWWYDSTRPESAGFMGFQILSIEGRFGNTRSVEVFTGPGCDLTNRYQVSSKAQILTIEAAAYGLSCCSISYGIRALRHLLSGCGCEDTCKGTQLKLYDCDPNAVASDSIASMACFLPDTGFVLPVETTSPWRMLTNVKLLEMPEVVQQQGKSCGACGCGDYTVIRFTVAADPGAYLDSFIVRAATPIAAGECVVACDDEDCSQGNILIDPNCPSPTFVAPGDAALPCFCKPLFRFETCFEFDLGIDSMFTSELEFTINAGDRPLRNLEVRIWKKFGNLDMASGAYNNCNACAGFFVNYIPQGARLDRTVCGSTVAFGYRQVDASSALSGPTGSGDACVRLGCGTYIACVYADGENTSTTATIEISAREFEP